MANRFFLFVAAAGIFLSATAADYFPTQARNAWTFSYVKTTAPVVPNPPTTKDSGTIQWKIYSNEQLELVTVTRIIQTRNLMRRTLAMSGSGGYDSVFSPARTTIDTLILTERSDRPGICFPGDTCSFAVHDPTVTMPARLLSKDTMVSSMGESLPIAGKKMIVSECSCLHAWYSYSFILGPTTGPVEAYISMCPGLAGSSYEEKWKLINREYPTAILKGNAQEAIYKTVAVSQSLGRINCRLHLESASPVAIDFVDLKGRLIQTLLQRDLKAGVYQYSWNIPKSAFSIALLHVRTGTEDRCIKIMTEAKYHQ